MKVLHIGKPGNVETYSAPGSFAEQLERAEAPMGLSAEEYLTAGGDADFIVVDAIGEVSGELIRKMPNLKLIHSEGVGYNRIDTAAAAECGVYVCNCQGMNAAAVAEQTLLLMLGILRDVAGGDRAVREGDQIGTKEAYMIRGDLQELADCTVGLVGFGDIARKTADYLAAFGVRRILYTKRNRLSESEEKAMEAHLSVCSGAAVEFVFAPMTELLAESDIVSLHVPVSGSTVHMADADFFDAMKDGSYFINTSRGELVDDEALVQALRSGKLRMAGLDTLDHEPVAADHPLVCAGEAADRILFSPHIGGITASSFRRGYAMIWEDVQDAAEGRVPQRVVNQPIKGGK